MSHIYDKGKGRLRALIRKAQEALPRLPLVHSTDAYRLVDAIGDGAVNPHACKVFTGEALTYFFYGRPSFRPNAQEDPSGLGHYFPVALLFRADQIPSIKRIFPFDSGAFEEGLYGRFLHKRMALGDFNLEPDIATPGKLVSTFFGAVPAYLNARPELQAKFDPSEFEALSYSALINSKDSNATDSRGSGIEIQTSDVVPLKGAVEAIILPSIFADQSTGKQLKALGIELIPYRTSDRMKPTEYTSQITDLCFNYYVRRKLINEADL